MPDIIQGTPADNSSGVFLSGDADLYGSVGKALKSVIDVLLLNIRKKSLKNLKKVLDITGSPN